MKKERIDTVKRISVDIVFDVLGSILFAAGIYTFALNAQFAPAGISGLSLIINHFTGWPIGVISLILNVPIIAVCYRVLGTKFFLKSLKSMLISAFFMDIVFPLLPTYTGMPLLASIFSGILAGAGLALIYLRDSSTGGTDFVIMAVRKKAPHLSIGQITLIVDGVIIALGGVVFKQVDAVLYGILSTTATMLIIDKIMDGAVAGKLAMVISEQGDEIAKSISNTIGRGSTMIAGKGTYTGHERQVLVCA
ncbi:MAG: YitT family protein, partial [Clostridia bacterium]